MIKVLEFVLNTDAELDIAVDANMLSTRYKTIYFVDEGRPTPVLVIVHPKGFDLEELRNAITFALTAKRTMIVLFNRVHYSKVEEAVSAISCSLSAISLNVIDEKQRRDLKLEIKETASLPVDVQEVELTAVYMLHQISMDNKVQQEMDEKMDRQNVISQRWDRYFITPEHQLRYPYRLSRVGI